MQAQLSALVLHPRSQLTVLLRALLVVLLVCVCVAFAVLWTWKIHAVTTMLDPFEVALLTCMTIGMMLALGMYLASFWSAL